MKKQIDKLIEIHKEGDYQKYLMKCSIKDFKYFQKILSTEYKIKDDWGSKALWTYSLSNPNRERTGTVKFNNFEINVICPSEYDGDLILESIDEVDYKVFKNSKKQ